MASGSGTGKPDAKTLLMFLLAMLALWGWLAKEMKTNMRAASEQEIITLAQEGPCQKSHVERWLRSAMSNDMRRSELQEIRNACASEEAETAAPTEAQTSDEK